MTKQTETNPFRRKPVQNNDASTAGTDVPQTPTKNEPASPTDAFSQIQLKEPESSTNVQAHTPQPEVDKDDKDLIDFDPAPEPLSRQSTWEKFDDADGEDNQKQDKGKAKAVEQLSVPEDDVPPALPPRKQEEEIPPSLPQRPKSPSQEKNPVYQIKIIEWTDPEAGAANPRKSPILIQNANGPCPLVALVNALTLSNRSKGAESSLQGALKSREQISLELLLSSMIEDLVNTWQETSGEPLPDPTELFTFLQRLHTGMNTNPCFISTSDYQSRSDPSGDLRTFSPGTFEQTYDMRLYASFSIPLVHGWLPHPREDPAYEAFRRQASSYDDAVVLFYRQEDLESQLDTGLSGEEQQLYQDIIFMRTFTQSWPNQLTPWGLEAVIQTTQPGTFSILYRNDHFSLIYRHPETKQLFALVTDAGFATHDQIVWESLVDTNAKGTEYYSGDFRHYEQQTNESNNQGRGNDASRSPNLEQEDSDLAFALHLQEQEDQRHREEQDRRRREAELSETFIERQGSNTRTGPRGRGSSSVSSRGGRGIAIAPIRNSTGQINIPVRGPSNNNDNNNNNNRGGAGGPAQQIRPLVPPPATPINTSTYRPAQSEQEEPPPSYEQASKATPYVPPAGHPSHPETSVANAQRRTSSGVVSSSACAGASNRHGPPPIPRPAPPLSQPSQTDKEKCTIM